MSSVHADAARPYGGGPYAGGGAPLITQRVYMWTAPSPTSPYSLAKAVELLTTSNWEEWDIQRVNSLFDFLTVSEQPNRWPLVEKMQRGAKIIQASGATRNEKRLRLHVTAKIAQLDAFKFKPDRRQIRVA